MHSAERTFEFAARTMPAGELAKALSAALLAAGLTPPADRYSLSVDLPDGTHTTKYISLTELENMVITTESVSVVASAAGTRVDIHVYVIDEVLCLALRVNPPSMLIAVKDAFQSVLALAAPAKKSGRPTLWAEIDRIVAEATSPLASRLAALEDVGSGKSRRLKAFLSFRFNDASEIIALRIQQFLALCDVEVTTGEAYEPRQVTEKVLSRLQQTHDLVVLLITTHGESMWTRDEISTAIHRKIALIPIVENGASFEPGLFGDIEYIPFASGHIGDAFIKLLQALRFVREQPASSKP